MVRSLIILTITHLFSALSIFFLGSYVYLKDPKNKLFSSFFVMSAFISIWTILGLAMELQAHANSVPIWTSRVSMLFASLIAPSFIVFSLYFPVPNHKINKSLITVAYSLAIISGILALQGAYISEMTIIKGTIHRTFEPAFAYFFLCFVGFVLFAVINQAIKYLHLNKTDRIRVNFALAGIFLGFFIGTVFSAILPILGLDRLFFIGKLGPLILMGFLTYAILKYRLMNVVFVIKKTTAYSIITTGITFVYLAIILTFEILFRSIFSGYYSVWMALPAALVIAITFIPMRNYFQNITDQIFFRRSIEYRKVLREVTHAISSVTDLKVLFRLIDQTVVRVMCIKTASVLLLEEKQDHYVVEKTNGLPKTIEGIVVARDNPLILQLIEIREPIEIDDIKEKFNYSRNKEEREKLAGIIKELDALSAALAVPSFVKNKLVGILTLGEKLSEEAYSQEDIELIATMAAEAGIAIENAKLYRDITETKDYLDSIIQNSDDAIITLDLSGQILSWNAGAEKIFGYKTEEMLGKYPPFLPEIETKEFVSRILYGETIKALEISKETRSNSKADLLLSCSPIKGDGKTIGVSLILKDISELKKVDKTKREFLSTVSHELRTPLTPIKGYVALLLQGNIGPLEPRQKEALETVLKNTNHLHDLIESIIDISRIEAGKPLEIEKEPFFIEKTVKESVDNAFSAFTAKNINLTFNYTEGDIAIIGDRKKITRVMDNLLGNALKFTPGGGQVTVTMRREDQLVNVTITDTGIGLDKKYSFKIFERFFQVDSSYTRATGGIGMGLAIAKEIVEAHGGRIWVESNGVGHGTSFIFTLPLS